MKNKLKNQELLSQINQICTIDKICNKPKSIIYQSHLCTQSSQIIIDRYQMKKSQKHTNTQQHPEQKKSKKPHIHSETTDRQPIMNPTSPSPLTQIHTADISSLQHTILQRKRDNIQLIFSCYDQHHSYYHQHIKLLSSIQVSIAKNIQETRAFCIETFQYFQFIKNSYNSLLKTIGKKTSTFPYFGEKDGKEWYEHMCEGMKGLENVNGEIGLQLTLFYEWEEGTFLPQLLKAMEFYVQPLKMYSEKLAEKRDLVNLALKALQKRFQKIRKNTTEMLSQRSYKGDLLYEQLEFIVLCKMFRQDIREWGRSVHTYWTVLQKNENTLLNSVKRDIETFFIQIQKLHRGAQFHKQVKEFWNKIKIENQIANGYSLDRLISQESLNFLNSNFSGASTEVKVLKLINAQRKDELIQSVQDFIDTLTFKSFSCKTSSDRANVLVLSSVDSNLVYCLADSKQPLKRMVLRLVSTRRINQYSVEVIEVVRGFLVDSLRKDILHFNSEDEVEEFIHYVNAVPHQE